MAPTSRANILGSLLITVAACSEGSMKVEELIALSREEAVVAATPGHVLLADPNGARWTSALAAPVAGVELGRWAAATVDVVAIATADASGHAVEGLTRGDGRRRFRVPIGEASSARHDGDDPFVGLWADGRDIFAVGPAQAGSVLARIDGTSGEVKWRVTLEGARQMHWADIGRHALVLATRGAAWEIEREGGAVIERFEARGTGCRVGRRYVTYRPDALELRDLDDGRPMSRVPLRRAGGVPDERSSVMMACGERDGSLVAMFGPLAYTLARIDLDGRVMWELALPGVTLESHRFVGGPWPERGALAGGGRFATLAVSGDDGRSLLSIDLDEGRLARRAGPAPDMPRWTVIQADGLSLLSTSQRRIALIDTVTGAVRAGARLDAPGLEPMPWHLAGATLWQTVRGANAKDAPWSRLDLGSVGAREEAERWLNLSGPDAPHGDVAP